MAIEEKVVQSESVAPTDQSVTETPSQTQPQAPNLDSIKAEYEALKALNLNLMMSINKKKKNVQKI